MRAPAKAGGSPGVEESTRKAMQMLSALSDAAVSGGKLSAEMSSTTNAGNAKCQPWSRHDFLSRLASFSPMNWFNKPVAISAAECARHGWRNDGEDRLRCDSCRERVTVVIHPSLNEDSRLAVAARFKQQLVKTGHSDMCPWRDQGVPLALIQLPGSSAFEVLADCEARLESLQRCEVLPEIDVAFLQSSDVIKIKDIVHWPQQQPIDPALVLAACGWHAVAVSEVATLSHSTTGASPSKSHTSDSVSDPHKTTSTLSQVAPVDVSRLDAKHTVLVCVADQRSCPVWNFRCKPLAKSSARIVLLEHDSAEPLHADGGGASGKGRKRSVAEAGLEGEREAADEGQESLFTDAIKRTKILGGVSLGGGAQQAQALFGLGGFGGNWGDGGGMDVGVVGPQWATAPLGALTSPPPKASAAAAQSRPAGPFHPVTQHRSGSQWTAPFTWLPASSLPSRELAASPAWVQCLALALQAVRSAKGGPVGKSLAVGGADVSDAVALPAALAEDKNGNVVIDDARRCIHRWIC